MAVKKLSALTELAVTPSGDDLYLISDVSEALDIDKSKKIKHETLNNAVITSLSGKLGYLNIETISDTKTLTDLSRRLQYLNPVGSQNVSLPAVSEDNPQFVIRNASASSDLVVKDSGGDTIVTVSGGEVASLISTSAGWTSIPGTYKQLWLANFRPTVTNGCFYRQQIEMGTHKNVYDYLEFDKDTAQYAYVNVALPSDYNGGNLLAKFYWLHPATVTNFGVRWGIRGVVIDNDETLDAEQGTAKEVTDTGGVTSKLYISGLTAAFTLAGDPAPGKLANLQVYRAAAHAEDDMAVKAYLIGAMLWYQVG